MSTAGSDSRRALPPPSIVAGSSGGDRLLVVFTAATLIMVAAVVAVGAVDRPWVLVPVMGMDLAVLFVVIATLVGLMRGGRGPSA